jgi:hypothetical protein
MDVNKKYALCVISGFHRGVNEILALLGCYAVYIGCCLSFETTYWSQLQGPYGTVRLSRKVTN